MNNKKRIISKKAFELGFHSIGFTKPKINDINQKNYKNFINKGLHGQMSWMARHYEKKINPKKVWNEVKSILVLGINYSPGFNPLKDNEIKTNANISVYARNQDYHLVINKRLNQFKEWFALKFNIEVKTFIDTAPIFEKPLAQKSGIGWQGKHTNIVSKEYGSWLFLSEIFLPLNLTENMEAEDNCGKCNDCIKVCPTDAFISENKIDARKCISYLTIEHKGPFPMSLRKKIGNKVYGCDDCLSVCPWNKFSKITNIPELTSKIVLKSPKLLTFLYFNEEKFKFFFKSSPIKRIGWVSFIRNILIASGNSKSRALSKRVKFYISDQNPIIRGTAIWAYGQLSNKFERKKIKEQNINKEQNKYVLYEISSLN